MKILKLFKNLFVIATLSQVLYGLFFIYTLDLNLLNWTQGTRFWFASGILSIACGVFMLSYVEPPIKFIDIDRKHRG